MSTDPYSSFSNTHQVHTRSASLPVLLPRNPSPPGKPMDLSMLEESDRFKMRRMRIMRYEQEQQAEDMEAIRMITQHQDSLIIPSNAVKTEFSDLDGQSWSKPEARKLLESWRTLNPPPPPRYDGLPNRPHTHSPRSPLLYSSTTLNNYGNHHHPHVSPLPLPSYSTIRGPKLSSSPPPGSVLPISSKARHCIQSTTNLNNIRSSVSDLDHCYGFGQRPRAHTMNTVLQPTHNSPRITQQYEQQQRDYGSGGDLGFMRGSGDYDDLPGGKKVGPMSGWVEPPPLSLSSSSSSSSSASTTPSTSTNLNIPLMSRSFESNNKNNEEEKGRGRSISISDIPSGFISRSSSPFSSSSLSSPYPSLEVGPLPTSHRNIPKEMFFQTANEDDKFYSSSNAVGGVGGDCIIENSFSRRDGVGKRKWVEEDTRTVRGTPPPPPPPSKTMSRASGRRMSIEVSRFR